MVIISNCGCGTVAITGHVHQIIIMHFLNNPSVAIFKIIFGTPENLTTFKIVALADEFCVAETNSQFQDSDKSSNFQIVELSKSKVFICNLEAMLVVIRI